MLTMAIGVLVLTAGAAAIGLRVYELVQAWKTERRRQQAVSRLDQHTAKPWPMMVVILIGVVVCAAIIYAGGSARLPSRLALGALGAVTLAKFGRDAYRQM
jgi:hypothetical protein